MAASDCLDVAEPLETIGLEPSCKALESRPLILASGLLQRVHDDAPPDYFTLSWLMTGLSRRSFGVIMLLLAVVGIAPGITIGAGLLMMIPAFQMVVGRQAAIFPRRIASHPIPTRHLAALVQRAVPILRYLEKFTHPRWHTPPGATKRIVGLVVMMLSATLVVIPIPLSNVPPALAIALIALAYLEEDGLLLGLGLLAAVALLVAEAVAVQEIISGAKWIGRFS